VWQAKLIKRDPDLEANFSMPKKDSMGIGSGQYQFCSVLLVHDSARTKASTS
jgi:hypothetical protein